MKNKVIATWSGGKDSTFAAYKAVKAGYELSAIANTISKDYKRVRFHGLEARMIELQAEALGVSLLQAETTPANYEEEFIANIRRGLTSDTQAVVFGDIHLEDCFLWAQKICNELEVQILEPHFGKNPQELLLDLINSGFEAVIVSTQANLLGEEWVGRKIDTEFLADIKKLKNIDPCGENGEYHTLVLDGPFFRKRINLIKTKKVLRGGYYFLDIQACELVSK